MSPFFYGDECPHVGTNVSKPTIRRNSLATRAFAGQDGQRMFRSGAPGADHVFVCRCKIIEIPPISPADAVGGAFAVPLDTSTCI
jgi:hypothetical protein